MYISRLWGKEVQRDREHSACHRRRDRRPYRWRPRPGPVGVRGRRPAGRRSTSSRAACAATPWRSCPACAAGARAAPAAGAAVRARRTLSDRLLPHRPAAAGRERARPPRRVRRAGDRPPRCSPTRCPRSSRSCSSPRVCRASCACRAPAAVRRPAALAAARGALPRLARARGDRRRRATPGAARSSSRTPATRSPSSPPGRLRGVASPRGLLAPVFGGAPVEEVDAPAGLAAAGAPARRSRPSPTRPTPRRWPAACSRTPTTTCPWCGEPHAALPCALCGHDRDRAIGRQEMTA